MFDFEEETRREELEFVDKAKQLQQLRQSPGFSVFLEMIKTRLSRVFQDFVHERDPEKILSSANEGATIYGILREIDDTIERAEVIGRELIERAEEEEAVQRRRDLRESSQRIRERRGSGVGL